MNPTDLLAALHTAERLKDVTRHSYTSGGRTPPATAAPLTAARKAWQSTAGASP